MDNENSNRVISLEAFVLLVMWRLLSLIGSAHVCP